MKKNLLFLLLISCLLSGCYGVQGAPAYRRTTYTVYQEIPQDVPTQARGSNRYFDRIVPAASPIFQPVTLGKLANYGSIKKKMSQEEFRQAYAMALEIVRPLSGLPREQQLVGIAQALRAVFDAGGTYSVERKHYNDPYGYLVLNTASCAGSARTTGLCLNILGIRYEHINENKWSHQWCRVNVNGQHWICDPFGLYVGPEPAPYRHPSL